MIFIVIVVLAVAGYFIYKKVQEKNQPDTTFTGRAFMDPEEYRKQEELQNRKAGAEEAAAGSSEPRPFKVASGVKLLLVDDDKKDIYHLTQLAEAVGAEVVTADNGIQCLDTVKNHSFDIIFIARDMSRMDGVQTFRNMKKQEMKLSEDVKVFAVVNRDSDEPAVFFEREGFSGVLRKPVGEYLFCQALADSLPKEKVIADDALLQEIHMMAGHEKKLQESGIQLSAALMNYGGNVKQFREEAAAFCENYEEESGSIMDSLYAGNAREYMDKVREKRNLSKKLGALYLADMFDDHVNMAKNQDMDIAEASWRNLELEWEHVVSGFSQWLGRNDTITSATEILAKDE